MAKMACSGSLAPHFVNNDYVRAEIFIAAHMRIVRYTLGRGLCEVHTYMSSCIMAVSVGLEYSTNTALTPVSARREAMCLHAVLCLLLQLLCQPEENRSACSSYGSPCLLQAS